MVVVIGRYATHPVHVENIDVVRAELLQRLLDRNHQGLDVVPCVVNLLTKAFGLAALVVRSILQRTGTVNNQNLKSNQQ